MKPGDLSKLLNKRKSSPTVPFKNDVSVEGFFDSWINSPEYKRRLVQNQYLNPDQIISNRNVALGNLDFEMSDKYPTQASSPATSTSRGYVNINPQDTGKFGFDTMKSHEISHVIGSKPLWQNPNIGFNTTEEDLIKQYRANPSSNAHDRLPEEMKADLDAVRYNMFKKGLYDISSGNPFTKEHLDKSLPLLKEDSSFKRLFDQTGDDNFIQMMNTIASNKTNNTTMAQYGGLINPIEQEQLSFGGVLQGVGRGAALGAKLGTIVPGVGNVIGGVLGGVGGGLINFFKGRKEKKEAEAQLQLDNQQNQLTQSTLANTNYNMMNSSNLPMSLGGEMYSEGGSMNPLTEFNVGGTHEQNPLGGIPQGLNPQGKMQTVEQNETKFKFKDGDYIFSNRLML